jgi:hypothetical protein
MRQKNRGFEVTKAYWSTSAGKTVRLNESDWESLGWKLKTRTLENSDKYSSKYLVGVIGEKDGRKWLTERGYEVYEFGMMGHYFEELENTVDGLKRRRKQEYIKDDRRYINALEHKLKGVFGEEFEGMRKFFCAFLQQRKEIKEEARRTRLFAEQIGGISPDFIVKKNNDFSFVEVKANQSMLSKHQRTCFKIAKRYGFKTFVLRVKVESSISKDFCLIEF